MAAAEGPVVNGSLKQSFAGPAACDAAGEPLDLHHAQRVVAVIKAANRLSADRHLILYLEINALSVKPVVWIANDVRLGALVAKEQAAYYVSGTDAIGAYRIGQFRLEDVIVKWIERGH